MIAFVRSRAQELPAPREGSHLNALVRWCLGHRSVVLLTTILVVMRDGREVDRVVGALPRSALEQRLAPLLAT